MTSVIGISNNTSRQVFAATAIRGSGTSSFIDVPDTVETVGEFRADRFERRCGETAVQGPARPNGTADGRRHCWDPTGAVEDALTTHLGHRDDLELFIVSHDQRILLAPASTDHGAALPLRSVTDARDGQSGWRLETWPDGKKYVTGYAPADGDGSLEAPGWVVLVRQAVSRDFAHGSATPAAIGPTGSALSSIAAIVGWVAVTVSATASKRRAAAHRSSRRDTADGRTVGRSGDSPRVFAALAALIDSLAHKERALDAMTDRAYRDVLTGLANRAALERFLDGASARGEAWAVLAVDLDGFKSVNDRLGHDAGDKLLRLAATRIGNCTRDCDFAARAGGDEFVVFLRLDEDLTDRAAGEIAERLIAAVACPYKIDGRIARVGASIGMAMVPSGCRDLRAVLRTADSALYAAKRQGRGRLIVHGRGDHPAPAE